MSYITIPGVRSELESYLVISLRAPFNAVEQGMSRRQSSGVGGGVSPWVKVLCLPGPLDQTLPVGGSFQSWTALVSTSSRDGGWEGVRVGGGELASRGPYSACLLPAHTHRETINRQTLNLSAN